MMALSIAIGVAALIFDCDNTLAHTLPIHYVCLAEVFARRSLVLSREWYAERIGLSGQDLLADYAAHYGSAPAWSEIVAELPSLYAERVIDVTEIVQVTEIVRNQAGKRPLAVASGSPCKLVLPTLEAIGIAELFQVIVTLDDTQVGKPAPDLFLMAAQRLAVTPSRCLVFEDSIEGLEAARRAGMPAIDVATLMADV